MRTSHVGGKPLEERRKEGGEKETIPIKTNNRKTNWHKRVRGDCKKGGGYKRYFRNAQGRGKRGTAENIINHGGKKTEQKTNNVGVPRKRGKNEPWAIQSNQDITACVGKTEKRGNWGEERFKIGGGRTPSMRTGARLLRTAENREKPGREVHQELLKASKRFTAQENLRMNEKRKQKGGKGGSIEKTALNQA